MTPMNQINSTEVFSLLTSWSGRPDAATDLHEIFGINPRKATVFLEQIKIGDFSWLPKAEILHSEILSPAIAAYARETATIYLSDNCPPEFINEAILEEIGHHIDALFNTEETAGDEGALFSATVRGIALSEREICDILNEDDSASILVNGSQLLVECIIPRMATLPAAPAAPQAKDTIQSAVSTLLPATAHGLVGTGLASISLTGNSPSSPLTYNYLQANSGNDTLIAGNAAATSMVGGSVNNWFLGGTGSQTDFFRGGSGNSTMVAGSGLATLVGGTGNNSLKAGSGTQSLVGGSGSNTLIGGIGSDILRAGSGTNTLNSGSAVNGGNTLIGGGTSSSLSAGLGNDSLYALSGKATLVGGTGKDILIGGTGTNSLVSGSGLSGGNTLVGGSGSNTLVSGIGKDSIVGGAGNNLLIVDEGLVATDPPSLSSTGHNTLGISHASTFTLSDSLLSNWAKTVSNLQTVKDLSSSSNKFLLGANAQSVGIHTIIGGAGSETLSIAGYSPASASSVLLDGSSSTLGHESLVGGGTGNDTFLGSQSGHDTLVGAGGNNLFELSGGTIGLGGDSIVGGTSLLPDTLVFGSAVTLPGTGTGSMSHIGVLSLTGGTNNISALGASGIQTILGGTGGGDIINASTATANIDINDSASTLGDTLTSSTVLGVTSTLIGSSKGANLFNVTSFATPVTGGLGIDTLNLNTAGTFNDSLFAHDTSVDVLELTSNSSVTLGGDALNAGISTVIGGTGSDTFTSSATLNGGFSKGLFIDASSNTGSSSYTGGFGNDTLKISSTVLSTSTVNGGGGTNLLELSNAGVSINASTITKFQELSLSGGSNSVYGIGSSGIQTILGGTGGRDTFDASTAVTGGFINDSASTLGDTLNASTVSGAASTLIGSKNAGNYFTVASEAALALDSLVGGSGTDTLVYGGNNLSSGDFSKDSLNGSINLLSLTGGGHKNFVFDSIAAAAGISTVIAGSAGGDTLDASGYTSGTIFVNASTALVADTLIGSTGAADSTLIGSQVNGIGNTFILSSTAQLSSDSLYGNQRTTNNILDFTTGGQTLNDTLIAGAKISSVEILSLSGGGNVVGLGSNAQAAKINYVYGSKTAGTIGGDSLSAVGITQGSITLDGSGSGTGDTLAAGIGASRSVLIGSSLAGATNYFQISNASLLGNDSIIGSAASGVTDILQITSSRQKANDAIFAHSALTSHLNILSLTGGQDGGQDTLTLGANAEKSFTNSFLTINVDSLNSGSNYIDGSGLDSLSNLAINAQGNPNSGVSGDTIFAGKGGNTLLGGIAASANNLFIFNGANALTNASIIGGGGINTLQVTGNGQILNDNSFANIAGIDVLNLNSTNGSNSGVSDQLTLASNAASAGITTIIGGSGPSTIDASAFSNTSGNALTWNLAKSRGGDSLIGAATGNDFQVENVSNLTNSTITGAFGNTDTLQMLTGAQTIGDVAFSNDFSIGELILGSATNANWLTVGAIAENAGIQTIVGGASKDTIDASGVSSADNVYIDGSIGTGDSILGGTGSNTLVGASAGVNNFVLAGTSFLSTSSIVGGNSGNDTIAFSSQANIQIGDLANVSNIGALEFLASGGNQIALGTDALLAGISTIIGGQGNDTGGDNIDFSAYGTAGVVMQITDQSYLDNTDTGINSTITGDTGADTLQFTRDGVSVTDADFANVSNMQVVQTANGNNHFLLGNDFKTAGVQTLIGGTGADTIDLTDAGYFPTSVITYNLAHNTSSTFITPIEDIHAASIVGGSGANWMYLSDGGDVTDSLFSGDYQAKIGNIAFKGGTTNATLGTAAHGAGINTIYLGEKNWKDTINVSGFQGKLVINGDITPNVIDGTNASDEYQYNNGFNGDVNVETSYAQLSNLTYNAHTGSSLHGSGNDSLSLIGTQARAITSDSLNGTFDALVLGNGNNFVQLTSTNNTGLTSIFGGANTDTLSTVGFTTLQGVDLVVNYANLTKDSLEGGYVFTGGRGSDTVTVATGTSGTGAVITDSSFSRMRDIQAIALDANGGNSLTLGGIAGGSVGIHTVYGGLGGHDTINASSSAYAANQDSVVGGNNIAPWDFTTIISSSTNLSTDYLTGAPSIPVNTTQSSHSILEITNLDLNSYSAPQSISDAAIGGGHISGFQEVDFDQNKNDSLNANSVTLGAATQSEGILTLNGGSGSLDLSILNASTFLHYVNGQPGPSLLGGANPGKYSGYNTVNILDTASSLNDKSFSGMTDFQILDFTGTGSNAVSLSGSAMSAGFTTILGGAGTNSFTQSAAVNSGNLGTDTLSALSNQADTLSLRIDGSAATSNSFSIATASQLGNDTIVGSSSGKDILTLGIAGDSLGQALSDTVFGGLKNIGTLDVLGVGANSIYLAADAQSAKIGNVILGSGTNLVNASADNYNFTLNGGTASADTLVAGSGSASLFGGTGSDSLVAGSGSDTLDAGYKGNDTLVAGSGADTFVLANASAGTYYGTSVPTLSSVEVTQATNFASISGFTTNDFIVLSKADVNANNYTLGITYNAQAATNTHFGLYDSGAFVADITTDGHFKVNTISDLTSGHVIKV